MGEQRRLLILLAARATEGLSLEESRELDRGLHELTDVDADDLDLAAAVADLAFETASADEESMPDNLRQQILEGARTQFASRAGDVPGIPQRSATPFRQPEKRKWGPLDVRYLGWFAAAAMLLLTLWAPWSPEIEPPESRPTFAEQRSILIVNAADVIKATWATPEIAEYAQVKGDVVWSDERQTGFMRLSGMPANRSGQEQYQLWIVDPSRDEHPIDGGVFNIPAGVDEIFVPINAKLRVADPKVFAITLEKPGGVVVSDGPLLVVAPVQS
jgi:hypothetical protein